MNEEDKRRRHPMMNTKTKMVGAAFLAVALAAGALFVAGRGGGTDKVNTPAAATRNIAINHVEKGCHVWDNGQATMRVLMGRGDTLNISNRDIDTHQLVETAGQDLLARTGTSGVMEMGSGTASVTFTEPGTYRFTTKVVEEEDEEEMEMPAGEETNPDNDLALEIAVR